MKQSWVNILCDPVDGTKLKLVDPVIKNGHIAKGRLLGKSGSVYRIKDGIPVLLPYDAQSLDSVESFAYEWDKWGFLFAKKNWLENIIWPLLGTESRFKGKIIVDAGAGSGAQSRWMAEAGAKLVISLELSNTIFSRHKKTIKGFENIIFPIQCDIARLPISIKPDILYCVNVLQHTENPKSTFKNLSTLMRKESIFLFNVYNKESILGSRVVEILRRIISLLPFRIWRVFSFLIALIIFVLLEIVPLVSKSINNIHLTNNLKELWLDIYDAFGAHHYQFPLSRNEQLVLFKEAKLKIKVKKYFGYLLSK